MIARSHRVNRRIRTAALQLAETLESRAYLSGGGSVVLGAPINTPAAANGMSPVTVSCADFTGNGEDDVCVANQNDTLSVLLSSGNGSFQTPVSSYAVAGAPVSLASGQFTSSGHMDIVAGTTGAGSAQGDVSILLGNGNGTFQSAINIPALHSNSAIAVGNFMTAGPLDIISVSNSASHVNNVCLTITDGYGYLASQIFFSTPFGSVSSVAVGDFGNGHEDFAVTEPLSESVSVYLGNGNGTFQTPVTYPTGTGTVPTAIVAGKFDASGNLGLVTADSTTGEISFFANQGDGIFGTAVISPVAGSASGGGPLSVCLGQFVANSEQDLVCLLSSGSSATAAVLLGNGDGTFRAGTTVTTSGANAVAAGDLTGNGLSDVVISSSSQISVLLTAGGLTLTTPATAASVNQGGNYTIDWTGGIPTDTVQLWAEGGPNNAWIELTAGVPDSNGSYTWNTTGVMHGWYYFQAWDIPASGTSYAVVSPNWLHVVAPAAAAPNTSLSNPPLAAASVAQGGNYTLNFTATDGTGDSNPIHVQLWVYSGNTGLWTELPNANYLPSSPGSYAWNTTGIAPGWYSFTAHATNGDAWSYAASPGWLNITVPTPTIAFTTPTSGQSATAGGTFNLNWNITGLSTADAGNATVQIWAQHLVSGSPVWQELTASVSASGGTYAWTVPTSPGTGTYYAFSLWLNDGDEWWAQASPNWLQVT